MRKTLLTLITVVGITSAGARDFESAGVWYTVLDEIEKTCKTREGSYEGAGAPGESFNGELKIPEKVSDGTTEFKVTEIGKFSFYGCTFTNRRILNDEIPASVKRIGASAFAKCNIEYLMLPENGVEKIDNGAFYNDNRGTSIKYAYLPQCVERQFNINYLEDIFTVENSRLIVAHHPWGSRNSDNKERVNIIYSDCKWDGVCLYSDTQYGRTLQFVSWAAEGTLKVPDAYTNVNGRYKGYENLSTILPRTLEYYDYDSRGFIGNMAAPAYYKYKAGQSAVNEYGSIIYYSDKAEIMDNCIYDEINWYSLLKKGNAYYNLEENKYLLTYYLPDSEIKSLIYTTENQPETFRVNEGTEMIALSFQGNQNLKTVEIPTSVKHIYNSFINLEMFCRCSLPSELTTVSSSFNNLPNLTEIHIPSTVRLFSGLRDCGISEIKRLFKNDC